METLHAISTFFRRASATIYPKSPESTADLSEQTIADFLLTRGLAKTACPTYAAAMATLVQTLMTLNTHSDGDITTALSAFNLAFAQQLITRGNPFSEVPDDQPACTNTACTDTACANTACVNTTCANTYFQDIDHAFITQLHQGLHDSNSPLQTNLYAALLQVYETMNANRSQYQLIYHQPRHAAEVFSDLHFLLQHDQAKEAYASLHLLTILCGLFHDIIFTRQRLLDETASANALKDFLKPIILGLLPAEQSIITALIDLIIIGGTTPCLLSKNNQGEPQPTLLSMAEVSCEFLMQKELNLQHSSILDATRLISLADIQRSSMLLLLNNSPCDHDPWQDLVAKLFDSLPPDDFLPEKCKFSQGFRVMAEMNATSESNLAPFANMVACLQSGHELDDSPMDWEKIIAALAEQIGQGLYSEINFAGRMDNTSKEYRHVATLDADNTLTDINPYALMVNKWPLHQQLLQKLFDYLTEPSIDLDSKVRQVLTLAQVTAYQDGGQLTITKVQQIATDIQELLNTMAPYVIATQRFN